MAPPPAPPPGTSAVRLASPEPGNAAVTARLRARGMSALGIGCARIGSLSSAQSLDEVRAMLALAAERGITLFDTAGIYGGGTSEQVVGAHARAHPGVFVMTKVGRRHTSLGRLAHALKRWARPMLGARGRGVARAVRQGNILLDFTPMALERAVDAAQHRLGGARIQALLLHSPPAELLAEPAPFQMLATFQRRGEADFVGLSCDTLPALRLAVAAPAMDIVQLPIALYLQAQREGLIDRIVARNSAIVLRGVLQDRGDQTPRAALAAAAALPGVGSVLAGVSSAGHLRALLEDR